MVRKDGTRFWASCVVAPLCDPEKSGFTVILRDETERRRVEDERAMLLEGERSARQEAEAANRAKDQFLAVLSHELRTPLTPVLATATALLDEPGTSDELRQAMGLIRRSVELECRLIDDLLDVSRAIHGKLHMHRAIVDVHRLVHQTFGICRDDLAGKRIDPGLFLDAGRHQVDADQPGCSRCSGT
jgi:signal transduction histidine kinase